MILNARLAIYIYAVLLLQNICGGEALACSCSHLPTMDEARIDADYIVAGRIIRVDAPPPRRMAGEKSSNIVSSADMLRYTVVPLLVWKGAPADTLVVFSARDSASCGYEMTIGCTYLLYPQLIAAPLRFKCEWAGGTPTGDVLAVPSRGRSGTSAPRPSTPTP